MPEPAVITVADAIRAYLADRRVEGQDTLRAEQQFNSHVLPVWGKTALVDLAIPSLRTWRDQLTARAPRRRPPKNNTGTPRYARIDLDDPDVRRRRRSTVNRITAQFKAALSYAARLYPEQCPEPNVWREGLRAYRAVAAPRERWLTRTEAQRLVAAAEPDFGRLVAAALYTGCRYGELCRARVRDFDLPGGRLSIPVSKSGRSRDVVLTDEAAGFFAQLVAGRRADEFLLVHQRSGEKSAPWARWQQGRPTRRACEIAGIEPPISFHVLRHTYASLAVQSGIALIALAKNLGHADTRMVERHYAHLSDSYLKSEIEAHAVSLGNWPTG